MSEIFKGVPIINLENMPVMQERFLTYYRNQQCIRTHVKVYAFTWRNFELEAQNISRKDQNICLRHPYWIPGGLVMFINVNLAEQFAKEMHLRLCHLDKELKCLP